MSVDDILSKLRSIFKLGITNMPGFRIGDMAGMALKTSEDIDNLPTTENRERDEGK